MAGSDSSIVRELPLDLEEGRHLPQGMTELPRETYNDWALISNLIEVEEIILTLCWERFFPVGLKVRPQ